jgi:U3 small nucleolar RNA-associated protein 5
MPDLVTRLAGLHATLTARLSLRESLLSLSGRLDMVLQQVDLRSSVAPTPMASRSKKGKAPAHTVDTPKTRHYVEGESEETEDVMEVEEEGSDAGSVEDVELGAGSESEAESDALDEDDDEEEEGEDEEDEDDGEDSEGDSEDDEGPRLNGFIDDEAEEDEEDCESE